jgi:hypothetical protein
MLGGARILVTIAACMSATPVAAQTPVPTTAFDGTYVGVSRTFEGTMNDRSAGPRGPPSGCVPNGQPEPLTIAGGVVRWTTQTVTGGTAEGSVNAQGLLVLHTPYGSRNRRSDRRARCRHRPIHRRLQLPPGLAEGG